MEELLGGNVPPPADTLLSDNLRMGSQALEDTNMKLLEANSNLGILLRTSLGSRRFFKSVSQTTKASKIFLKSKKQAGGTAV